MEASQCVEYTNMPKSKFHNQIVVNIPSKSITGEIGRKLLNAGFFHPDLDNDLERVCRKLVEEVFRSTFEQSYLLFERIDRSQSIIIEVQDDLGNKRPKAIGSFNMYRTRTYGDFHFSISGFYLYDLIVKTYDVPVQNHEINDGVIFHEILHMADFATLKYFSDDLDDAKSKHQSLPSHNIYTIYDPDIRLPREWQFMAAMSHFRNEGIAVLYEILLGYETPSIFSRKEAVDIFRHYFEPLKAIYARPFGSYLQQKESHLYSTLIESLHSLSYQIGPWMILDLLKSVDCLTERKLLSDAENILLNGGTLPVTDAATIITCAMQHDLGSFLKQLVGSISQEVFLKADEVVGLASYLTADDNEVHPKAKYVMRTIIESTINGSKDNFITALSEIIGYPMDNEEIEEYAKIFFAQKMTDDNHRYVMQQAKVVHERLKKSDSEFDRCVLSFVLDPHDLIKDDVKYLGYLDDVMILSAANSL